MMVGGGGDFRDVVACGSGYEAGLQPATELLRVTQAVGPGWYDSGRWPYEWSQRGRSGDTADCLRYLAATKSRVVTQRKLRGVTQKLRYRGSGLARRTAVKILLHFDPRVGFVVYENVEYLLVIVVVDLDFNCMLAGGIFIIRGA